MKNVNGIAVLEEHDIRKTCPSFYATHPKNGVSDRYTFLNTRDIALQLWEHGWMPTVATQMGSRDRSNVGFTRHMVRFAHKDFTMNGDRIELLGINSHNRASAFRFEVGIFRQVCSNGLVVKSSDFGSFSIQHKGDIRDQVHEAVNSLASNASLVAGKVDDFKTIELTKNEQGIYAQTVHDYLYKDNPNVPIEARDLLTARRFDDAKNTSLWNTFNIVQENVLQGGLRGKDSRGRRFTTRPVKSIERDVKLNQALWSMAERMAELKVH